jgi:very-short-patch-repair endonuclease
MLKGTRAAVKRAKRLRREMSFPEVLLWQELRKRPDGLKWRHQHPAGDYDLDFYCDSAKLCVEVDGEAHSRGDRPARDERRDRFLAERGIATMRVMAMDVLKDLESVVFGITHAATSARLSTGPLRGRSPSPAASPGEDSVYLNPPPSEDLGEGDHPRADGGGGGVSQ